TPSISSLPTRGSRWRSAGVTASAGSHCSGEHETPARPIPARVLAQPAARPLAHIRARQPAAAAAPDRGRHRLPLAHGVPARSRPQRDPRPHPRLPALHLQLAHQPELAVRAQPGSARERGHRGGAAALGEAVVGDPAAVRLAAREEPGDGGRARVAVAARGRRAVRVRHRDLEHPGLLPLALQLPPGALLRRLGVPGRSLRPRNREDAGDRARVPRARRHAAAEPYEPDGLAPADPAEPTLSRRGLLGLVGAGSLTLLAVTAGETIGGPLRRVALLAPRGRVFGTGPNDFQVNKTARTAGIPPGSTGDSWRLALDAPQPLSFTREQLLRLPQHTYDLPIACVEGWTTMQRWTGVRLADLAEMAGA